MSKQARLVKEVAASMVEEGRWRKWIAALLLAAALSGLPLLSANLPGPLSSLLAQPVHAGCQQGGTCG